MVGFHHDFGVAKTQDAQEAATLIGDLDRRQVSRDPAMMAALAKLESRVQTKAAVQSHAGLPHGVRTVRR